MAKITKVPNGPLIKKKGPYAGSTLKTGGTIKKAQTGAAMTRRDSLVANIKEQSRLRQNLVDFRKKVGNKRLTPELIREKDSLTSLVKNFGTKQRMKATGLTEQQIAKGDSIYTEQQRRKRTVEDDSGQLRGMGNDKPGCSGSQGASERRVRREARRKNGGPIKKAQAGKRVTRFMTDEEYKKETDSLSKRFRNTDPGFSISPKGSSKNTDPGFTKTPKNDNPNIKRKRVTSEDGTLQYLKNGGPIKKAQSGAKVDAEKYLEESKKRVKKIVTPLRKAEVKKGINTYEDYLTSKVNKKPKMKAGGMIKRAQNGESFTKDGNEYTYTKQVTRPEGKRKYEGKSIDQATAMKIANFKIRNNPSDSLRTVKPVIKKNGGMIKRADGSFSKRGLWDNIRANKGSGKKPTKQMLVQEKKIKAKSKK